MTEDVETPELDTMRVLRIKGSDHLCIFKGDVEDGKPVWVMTTPRGVLAHVNKQASLILSLQGEVEAKDAEIKNLRADANAGAETCRVTPKSAIGWQPIESAPRDGTWIALWRDPPQVRGVRSDPMVLARWFEFDDDEPGAAWCWPDGPYDPFTPFGIAIANREIDSGDCYEAADGFTHWQPLPEPPSPHPASAPIAERGEGVKPVKMILHCPKCGLQHIDAPEYAAPDMNNPGDVLWDNPPHRSHLCRPEHGGCGHIWRPADVPTEGVASIETRGKADGPAASLRSQVDRLRGALEWFDKHADELKADVLSAHHGRGNGTTQWMTEDDRDFRKALREALEAARQALSPEGLNRDPV